MVIDYIIYIMSNIFGSLYHLAEDRSITFGTKISVVFAIWVMTMESKTSHKRRDAIVLRICLKQCRVCAHWALGLMS